MNAPDVKKKNEQIRIHPDQILGDFGKPRANLWNSNNTRFNLYCSPFFRTRVFCDISGLRLRGRTPFPGLGKGVRFAPHNGRMASGTRFRLWQCEGTHPVTLAPIIPPASRPTPSVSLFHKFLEGPMGGEVGGSTRPPVPPNGVLN